jgi:hypothetical protein
MVSLSQYGGSTRIKAAANAIVVRLAAKESKKNGAASAGAPGNAPPNGALSRQGSMRTLTLTEAKQQAAAISKPPAVLPPAPATVTSNPVPPAPTPATPRTLPPLKISAGASMSCARLRV